MKLVATLVVTTAWATLLLLPGAVQAQTQADWTVALEGAHRAPGNVARNVYRHPRDTLAFFGLESGMTVVEIAPGGGWYTEVLAPLVTGSGRLYAAHYGLNAGAYQRRSLGNYLLKLAENPDLYNPVVVTQLRAPEKTGIAPPGSADLVVAFRNFHGWIRDDAVAETLAAIHTALRPGGIFGLVQHRAKPGLALDAMAESGYVTEAYAIEQARAAGFELVEQSEINANPKDTADHLRGVWTLPPVLRVSDEQREQYLAIGESDRMTLKFRKPRS